MLVFRIGPEPTVKTASLLCPDESSHSVIEEPSAPDRLRPSNSTSGSVTGAALGESELDGLVDAEGEAEAEGLPEADGDWLADGLVDGLGDGEALDEGLTEALGLKLGENDELGDTDGLAELDGLVEGLALADGDNDALGLIDGLLAPTVSHTFTLLVSFVMME
jgi:hypothetical protein